MLNTAVKDIPYPEESDPIAAYPAIIEANANQVDALLQNLGFKAAAIGTASVVITAANNGSVAIAFPVGRFATTPKLFVSIAGTAGSAKTVPRAAATSTTAGTVYLFTADGTAITATTSVNWLAVEV